MPLSNESFLPPEADCAESWRDIRWSDGVRCIYCNSRNVECRTEHYRGHLCRYHCLDCGRWFNDLTGTELEYSKVSLPRWFYLMRELDKGPPLTCIAEEIGVTYKTVLRMAYIVRRSLYFHRLKGRLQGEVESDDIHIKTGLQGLRCKKRPPRRRGLKRRGRGTYNDDLPLACIWVSRKPPDMAIEMLPDARKRTLLRATLKHVEPGSRIDTDSWRGYRILGQVYEHRFVKHSQGYVQDGVHCNRAEAEWSVFRPWWARYRGVSKRYAHLYLAQYEFKRRRRDKSGLERLYEMIGFIYAFWQSSLRQLGQFSLSPLCAICYR